MMILNCSYIIKKNIYSIVICSLIICIFLISCKKDFVEENEPNNSFSTAQKILINSKSKGYFNSIDDTDYYKLELERPGIIDIQLTAVKGVNHAFKVWRLDNKPVLLKLIDDSRKSSHERGSNLYFKDGTYYIAVTYGQKDVPKSNLESPYTLILQSRDLKENEEKENNDSVENANEINFDQEFQGYYSPSYNRLNNSKESPYLEEDWFYFDITISEDRPIIVDIELSGVPEINASLSLKSDSSESLEDSDHNGVGEGEVIKDIGITKSGRFYIVIAAKNYQSNVDIPYTIHLRKREHDSEFEMEPNNNFDTANTIIDSHINGKIQTARDIDYFIFNENEIQVPYKIEVVPPSDIDIVVNVFNKLNKKLFSIDNGPKGEKEIMPNALFRGDFVLNITSKNNEFNPNQGYTLSVSPLDVAENYEKEPNDQKESATKIDREDILGFNSKKADIDYFLLEFNQRVRCNVTIQGIKNSEIKMSITDPLGFTIKSISVKGNKSISLQETIDGKGYIIIESVVENYEKPYQLQIEEVK